MLLRLQEESAHSSENTLLHMRKDELIRSIYYSVLVSTFTEVISNEAA